MDPSIAQGDFVYLRVSLFAAPPGSPAVIVDLPLPGGAHQRVAVDASEVYAIPPKG